MQINQIEYLLIHVVRAGAKLSLIFNDEILKAFVVGTQTNRFYVVVTLQNRPYVGTQRKCLSQLDIQETQMSRDM